MERSAETEPYDPYHEIDDLIDTETCGEPLREALYRAVDQSYGLPAHQQLIRLLEINERAIFLDPNVRAGVQSSILDQAMEVCDTPHNPDAAWKLHVLQIRALSRDFTILQPQFYPGTVCGDMRRETVTALREHAKSALRIMSSRRLGNDESYYFCSRILATFPEFTT